MSGSDHSFIEESIRPGKHRRIRKFFKNIGVAATLGAVFGIVAASCFYATGFVLGHGNKSTEEVSLVVPTEEPENDKAESPKPQVSPAKEDKHETEDSGKVEISSEIKDAIEHYRTLYKELSAYCAVFDSTIVNIARISEEMDYFENRIERTASFYGLILQKTDNLLYVLTQYDEIDEEYTYSVVFEDGSNIPASIVGVDNITGLAVMTADISGLDKSVADNLKVAKIGSSHGISIGDMVVAIGNPMGTVGSVGYGVVCSKPRVEYLQDRKMCVYNTQMQTVDRGNGVIMDTTGKVVGIITRRFNNTPNLCCFIGINEIKSIIEKLMNGENYVGMGIVPMDIGQDYFADKDIENGIYVSDMFADTPALSAGIVVGDVITKIDGQDVKNVDEYMNILAGHRPNDTIYINIYCDYASRNKSKNVEVTLSEIQ